MNRGEKRDKTEGIESEDDDGGRDGVDSTVRRGEILDVEGEK
ncbi:unnamed protein product [Camellia sinensis]